MKKHRFFYSILFVFVVTQGWVWANDPTKNDVVKNLNDRIAAHHENLERLVDRRGEVKDSKENFEKIVKEKTKEIAKLEQDIADHGEEPHQDLDAQLAQAKKDRDKAQEALDKKDPAPKKYTIDGKEKQEAEMGLKQKLEELEKQIPAEKKNIDDLTAVRDARVNNQNELHKANGELAEALGDRASTDRTLDPDDPDRSALMEPHDKAVEAADRRVEGLKDQLAQIDKPFTAQPGIPVEDVQSANQPTPEQNTSLNAQSLTGNSSQLQTMDAVSNGRAAPDRELSLEMSNMANRAMDTSLSGDIKGQSNDGWRSNSGQAYVNGELVSGRYFEDIHGGGRYFVPDRAYGGKGLDGYMANRATDLSGLHQLNGSIASGNATRVGNNIQFDGFYNGAQTFKNGVWNAPANGVGAIRTNIPFSNPSIRTVAKTPPSTNTSTTQTSWASSFTAGLQSGLTNLYSGFWNLFKQK